MPGGAVVPMMSATSTALELVKCAISLVSVPPPFFSGADAPGLDPVLL